MATFPENSPSPNYPLNLRMRFATSKVGLGGDRIVSQRRSAVVFPVFFALCCFHYLVRAVRAATDRSASAEQGPS